MFWDSHRSGLSQESEPTVEERTFCLASDPYIRAGLQQIIENVSISMRVLRPLLEPHVQHSKSPVKVIPYGSAFPKATSAPLKLLRQMSVEGGPFARTAQSPPLHHSTSELEFQFPLGQANVGSHLLV